MGRVMGIAGAAMVAAGAIIVHTETHRSYMTLGTVLIATGAYMSAVAASM